MKVAVLMGGTSGEREVSLASGVQVARALREAGEEAVSVDTAGRILDLREEEFILGRGVKDPDPYDPVGDLLSTGDLGIFTREPELADTDVIFPALHGGRGEDGTVQLLLDLHGLPFVGSGSLGCALAMDKDLTKRLLRDAGVPTPRWVTLDGRRAGGEELDRLAHDLGLPLIVKPPSGGSTLGLTLAHDRVELEEALRLALDFEGMVMFEEYVRGREVTVGILGQEALPVGEIIPQHEIFDYECKYRPGMAQEIFPADLPEDRVREIQGRAFASHEALRLRDFSRVDFILDQDGESWCLEANALPGLTGNSLLPKAAGAAGIPFPELCRRLAGMALSRTSRGSPP